MSIFKEKRADVILHRANATLYREQARHTDMQGHKALADALRRAAIAETAMVTVLEANLIDGVYGPSPEDVVGFGEARHDG